MNRANEIMNHGKAMQKHLYFALSMESRVSSDGSSFPRLERQIEFRP